MEDDFGSDDVDAAIRALALCLSDLVDVTDPDRLPSALDDAWAARRDFGISYQFVVWQLVVLSLHSLNRLPCPITGYPIAARLAVVQVRDTIAAILERAGAAALAAATLAELATALEAERSIDWAGRAMPGSLLRATDDEREGLIGAFLEFRDAHEANSGGNSGETKMNRKRNARAAQLKDEGLTWAQVAGRLKADGLGIISEEGVRAAVWRDRRAGRL